MAKKATDSRQFEPLKELINNCMASKWYKLTQMIWSINVQLVLLA
jgi:hypothetical protein